MKDLLFVKKLHLLIFANEEWDFEHQHVCGFIRQHAKGNVYNHIANEKHARTLWEKIQSLYAS